MCCKNYYIVFYYCVSYVRRKRPVDFRGVSYMRRKQSQSKSVLFEFCNFSRAISQLYIKEEPIKLFLWHFCRYLWYFREQIAKQLNMHFSQRKIKQFVQNGQGREKVNFQLNILRKLAKKIFGIEGCWKIQEKIFWINIWK